MAPPRARPSQPDPRQVDACPAFVRRIVAHPQEAAMQREAGVAAVSRAWKLEHGPPCRLCHAGNERTVPIRLESSSSSPHFPGGEDDEIGAADPVPGRAPDPARVRRPASADPRASVSPLASNERSRPAAGIEAQGGLVGQAGNLEPADLPVVNAIRAFVQRDGPPPPGSRPCRKCRTPGSGTT